jgi:signal peptidase I
MSTEPNQYENEQPDIISSNVINEESIKGSDKSSHEKTKRSLKSIIIELSIYAIIIFFCIFIVPNYIIQRTVVDGESMMDNLMDGDSVIVNKFSYNFFKPARFDIIVFYPYGRDDPDDYYVKRIIGLPGETIQIKGSDIYINDEILEENYGKDPITDPGVAIDPIKLASDEYFVLGDNREISEDSRFFGPVQKDNISGHVVLRIYPFDKIGLLSYFSQSE